MSQAAPQNLEAEESVLGAMMLSDHAREAVCEIVRPGDFYRESHGVIFRVIESLHDAGAAVDAIVVADKLEEMGLLEKAGGRVRMHELAKLVTATSNAGFHAKIIREQAGLRGLIKAGERIAKLGWERPGELDELIGMAEKALSEAVEGNDNTHATALTDDLNVLLGEIRAAYKSGEAIFGEKTGYTALDDALSGLWSGQLVLIAARPGMGKSTLALNIAENFADRQEAVLFSSLEMSKHELGVRSLARAAKINSRVLATGMLTPELAERLGASVPKVLERTQLYIEDDGSMTVPRLKAEARRLRRTQDLRLIVVDYLQLMQGNGEESRQQEISVISRSLKQLARELDIPVIALSQMNRNIEHRGEKRPSLSDLRDSGSLEQDADVVLFLHADSHYDHNVDPDGTVEIIIAKNRKGPTDTVKMAYNKTWSAFHDLGGGSDGEG